MLSVPPSAELSKLARQVESYFGNVNCIGERSCYDEGKRAAETLTFDYMREHGLEVPAALPSRSQLAPRQPAMCFLSGCHKSCSSTSSTVISAWAPPLHLSFLLLKYESSC